MLNRFKLLHKQLALIATVLLLELFLIISLQIVLNQADHEARRSDRAYDVSMQATQLVKNCTDTATDLIMFGMTRNQEYENRYKVLSEEIPEKISILDKSSAEFVEDRENMRRIEVSASFWKQILAKVRTLMEGSREAGFTAYITSFFNHELKPHLRELTDDLVIFLEQHKKVQVAQTERLNKSKQLLSYVLIGGGVMQVLLAVLSFFFISRSVTDRLGVLTENTVRLGRGLPLREKIGGADEITQLDMVFHDMAGALAAAASKERAIVDGMPVGFITMSSIGLIMAANPRTLSMCRTTNDNVVGKPLTNFVTAPDGTSVTFQHIIDFARGRTADFQFSRADGTNFPVELFINSIQESEHELLICNILDVTERHEVERLKREFVSIVSHDLKTPLTAIQGSLYLLGQGALGSLNEQGVKVVKGSQQEATRLVSLVSDLLDVARMEAGRMDLNYDEFSTQSLVSRSVNAVQELANKKNIGLIIGDSNFDVSADEDRLIQVLVNLLSNAVKFSPLKTDIKINCSQTSGLLEVSVTDQGPGVDKEAQKRIFERFEQVNKKDRTELGGSGLGLAICKLIVEAHGGTIGVDSAPDQGSRFWFKIPAKKIDATEADHTD